MKRRSTFGVHFPVLASTAMALMFLNVPAYGEDNSSSNTQKLLLDSITVTGKSVAGYNTMNSSSATRTDTPLIEIPQSISVLPRSVIDDLQATRVEDALDYAGGFTRGNNFGGFSMASYSLRGFTTSEYFRNGFPANRNSPPAPDSITVERVEVLRGPAALLYGRGDPGGTFNIVTRQPKAKASYDLTARVSTFGAWRGAGSATSKLNQSGTVRYRMSGAIEGGDSYRDHVKSERYVLAPSLAFDLGSNTTITLDTEFVLALTPMDRGIPRFANQIPTTLPASRFLGEPSLNRWKARNGLGQLRLEHHFGGDWRLQAGVQYYNGRLSGPGVEFSSIRPDGRTLLRNYSERSNGWNNLDTQINLTGKLHTGSIEHVLLFGTEYEKSHFSSYIERSRPAANPFAIDILEPVYGRPLPPLFRTSDNYSDAKIYAVYAQDQISLTQWLKLLAGVRVEHYKSASTDLMTNNSSNFKQTVVTPRLGAVVLLNPNFSIYGSYAKSNKPNTAFDRFGKVLDPERGVSYEAGVKLDLLDSAFSFTTAFFHTVKENVSTTDPADNDFSIAAGKVRSRGIDVTFAGELTEGWRLIGGYTYADAEVTKDNVLPLGQPLPNAPRHSISALSIYEFQEGILRGLGLGTGVTHVGKRTTGTSATAPAIASYTLFNLLAYYDLTKKIRLQANVNNLFNKRYDERSFGSNLYPGAPLNAVFSVSAKF